MRKAIHPIFASTGHICYGDDRSVTRTRRGYHCKDEQSYLSSGDVFLHCYLCKYDWIMDKKNYIDGSGPPPGVLIRNTYWWELNLGTGGTGYTGQFDPNDSYSKYNSLANEGCCEGISELCNESENGLIYIADFYPLIVDVSEFTGQIGEYGELIIEYNSNGEPTFDKSQFSSPIKIYQDCSSKIVIDISQKWFGGYPLICPSCCKINFEARWTEFNDNPELKEKCGICNDVVIIDVQKVKSHLK